MNPGGWLACGLAVAAAAFCVCPARADCTATNLGIVPLPDLGFGAYKTSMGGLYPNGSNVRPEAHEAAGLSIASNEVLPRDAAANVETNSGKIVLLSIGMSNTTAEFGTNRLGAFKRRADVDPAKNPQLIIVDGAQGGQDASEWTNFNSPTWSVVQNRLTYLGVSSNQVQVIWMKHARRQPTNAFPADAELLQNNLEAILRVAQRRYPNLKIAYLSSRTRSYETDVPNLNPEPFAYESAFSVRWLIEKQLAGNLNYRAGDGPVVMPWLSWGPYLWADGMNPRSDGFIWGCSDLQSDYTHPSNSGVEKVATQLLAFFKTDPTATPWFLRKTAIGQPPTCSVSANVSKGVAPLTVSFLATANDADGTVRDIQWTFDDGTFSTNATPTKVFKTPGTYSARVTVTDNDGNTVTRSVPIAVAALVFGNPSLSGTAFQVPVLGATNFNYVVQRSDDLTDWVSLATNRGPFTFVETNTNAPWRFYRGLIQP